MVRYFIILLTITVSCNSETKKIKHSDKNTSDVIVTSEYRLYKAHSPKALLVLFPCFPCDAENTKNEFDIVDVSLNNSISVLMMNFNEHLYLKNSEKKNLKKFLEDVVFKYGLPKQNVFIGGFSSGGNVALLLGDILMKNKSIIQPKGIFIVDSPIDLLGLYKTAEKNLAQNSSQPSMQESMWIKNLLDQDFGKPEDGIENYELYAPYTYKTENISNISNLKDVKLRFYIEPDIKWWQKHAKNNYKDLNAFYIGKLTEKLKKEFGSKNIELITTKNKGYRANGERHPHSWSIVNKHDLVDWIKQ